MDKPEYRESYTFLAQSRVAGLVQEAVNIMQARFTPIFGCYEIALERYRSWQLAEMLCKERDAHVRTDYEWDMSEGFCLPGNKLLSCNSGEGWNLNG